MSTINYRAIHTKTKWRKVGIHRSLESALNGKDGAAGLFARTVRIDYQKHGNPLFVFIWEDGATHGWAVKASNNGITKVQVPMHLILKLEENGGDVPDVIDKIFA